MQQTLDIFVHSPLDRQQTSDVFDYSPLNRHASEIRLLRIRPCLGKSKSTIECVVEHVCTAENPRYTALSYAWGDQRLKTTILVNGKAADISENLHAALQTLRDSCADQIFWIDAICINQKDDFEKSWQVGMMLSIYQKAARTLVWLGSSANDSDLLFEGFHDLGADLAAVGLHTLDGEPLIDASKVVFDAISAFNKFKSPIGQAGTFEGLIFRRFYGEGRRELKQIFPPLAVKAFLDRVWWKRIWVLQEFSVSPSVTFMCGDMTAISPVVEASLLLIQIWNDAVLNMDSALFTMERVHEGRFAGLENYVENTKSSWCPMYDTEKHHRLLFQQRRFYQRQEEVCLLDLLEFAAGVQTGSPLQASDPRDIIFALLGLSSDAEKLGLKADYTRTIREVYEDIAIAFVNDGWHVMLSSTNIDFEAVRQKDWASWIPDWRRKFSMHQSRYRGAIHDISAGFNASKGLEKRNMSLYVLERPTLLELTCSVLDTVAEVRALPLSSIATRSCEPSLPLHDVSPGFIESVKAADRFAKDELHKLGYVFDVEDVVWRTLIADCVILALQRRTVACRTTRKTRRIYRTTFRAIIEDRLEDYVMKEQRQAMQKLLSDTQEGKPRKTGLANVQALPTTAAGELSQFAFTVTNMLAGRALLKTRRGLLCLGPVETKAGDTLVIGHTMPTPIVIRSLGRQWENQISGAYLGDVYIHGVMDGEAANLSLQQRIVNLQ